MKIWDIRQEKPIFSVEAHLQEVNSCEFNPFNEYLILTSSNDKTCALWDLRNLSQKLHTFKHHKNDVISARWNPNIMSLFASFSSDRRVNIWDCSQIGKSVPENDEDGPSELLFTHGGHTARISDMDWNANEELMCVSVALIEIFRCSARGPCSGLGIICKPSLHEPIHNLPLLSRCSE